MTDRQYSIAGGTQTNLIYSNNRSALDSRIGAYLVEIPTLRAHPIIFMFIVHLKKSRLPSKLNNVKYSIALLKITKQCMTHGR